MDEDVRTLTQLISDHGLVAVLAAIKAICVRHSIACSERNPIDDSGAFGWDIAAEAIGKSIGEVDGLGL
jgi:hypothetical protein